MMEFCWAFQVFLNPWRSLSSWPVVQTLTWTCCLYKEQWAWLSAPPLLPGQWPLQEPWFSPLLSGEATPLPWMTVSFELWLSDFVVLWALASWLLLLPSIFDFLPGLLALGGACVASSGCGEAFLTLPGLWSGCLSWGLLLGQTWSGRKCPYLSWLLGSPFKLTGWKGPTWLHLFSWGSSPQLHWLSWESSEWASSWAAFLLCAQEVIWSCQWPPGPWSWWTWGRGRVCVTQVLDTLASAGAWAGWHPLSGASAECKPWWLHQGALALQGGTAQEGGSLAFGCHYGSGLAFQTQMTRMILPWRSRRSMRCQWRQSPQEPLSRLMQVFKPLSPPWVITKTNP